MGKRLGQHFLKSRTVLRSVAEAVPVPHGATIVEIGPGKGALTEYLLHTGHRVIAVEKDPNLCEYLTGRFADAIADKHLALHCGDVRDNDWFHFVQKTPYVIIANIPFYLTGALIRDLLTRKQPPAALALVVQKELAERATQRNGKESLLSLSVQLFGTPTYGMTIKRRAFIPQPKVDAALLRITDVQTPPPSVQDAFFSLIHVAFREKRKVVLRKFKNNSVVFDLLTLHGVGETDRAENVPFSTWLSVARKIGA